MALAQERPNPKYLRIAIEGIVRAKSAFEQYQALRLARWLLESLTPDEREELQKALLNQETLQIDVQDSSRWKERNELLAKLGQNDQIEIPRS